MQKKETGSSQKINLENTPQKYDKSTDSGIRAYYNNGSIYKYKKLNENDFTINFMNNTMRADASYHTINAKDNSANFLTTRATDCSSTKPIITAKHILPFTSSTGRLPNKVIKPKEKDFNPIYNPKLDTIKKTPYFLADHFDKQTGRQNPIIGRNMEFMQIKDDVGGVTTSINDFNPVSRKKTLIKNNTTQPLMKKSKTTIDFKKSLGRIEGNKQLKDASLPLFMLRKMTSRFGVCAAGNEKTLELNNYSDRGFNNSTNYHGFTNTKKIEQDKMKELEDQYDEINEMLNRLIAKK